jgi:hypothetical protein
MILAYAAITPFVQWRERRRALPRETGDVQADLARLEEGHLGQVALDRAWRWSWASVALPMMAVALLGPLTAGVLLSSGTARPPNRLETLEILLNGSLRLQGPAMIALAVAYGIFAFRLLRLDDAALAAGRRTGIGIIYVVVVTLAIGPYIGLGLGLVFWLPLLIAQQVIVHVFHPVLCVLMTRLTLEERAALGRS